MDFTRLSGVILLDNNFAWVSDLFCCCTLLKNFFKFISLIYSHCILNKDLLEEYSGCFDSRSFTTLEAFMTIEIVRTISAVSTLETLPTIEAVAICVIICCSPCKKALGKTTKRHCNLI